jgi:hypothetical protein
LGQIVLQVCALIQLNWNLFHQNWS